MASKKPVAAKEGHPSRRHGTRKPGELVEGLNAFDWWTKVGTAEARRVSVAAQTTYEHFKHLAHGRRRPSVSLAKALSAASGGGMAVHALLGIEPEPRRRRAAADRAVTA